MKTLIYFFALGAIYLSHAQPNTEIYLLEISDKKIDLSIKPINISKNDGYDNQPSFWPDGKSLLYSRSVNGQTEIARYFIQSKKTKVITKTLQGSEYSPTPTPDGSISSIRLDTTGLQRLYAYDLKGDNKVLVKELVIGYHAWISENELVCFVLGDTATLQQVNMQTGKSVVIGKNIGRSLHKIPDAERFSFVDKTTTPWVIKSRPISSGDEIALTTTLEESEDYCWTPSGEIIMGQKDKLWVWSKEKTWQLFADLSIFGLEGITRLAISPDGKYLAVVVEQ